MVDACLLVEALAGGGDLGAKARAVLAETQGCRVVTTEGELAACPARTCPVEVVRA